ncbi:efflux RND transporter permease subunit [Polymorphobacter fuscus]|uniref:AcrB/AcrD/AcrF family protein n=1 Tax=Sandarakinorhabdus fusca TaxID=1439888 RepID=A0A7C9KXV6_9SPHN|nr:efflux RND transporter permease subunit [Polymorphobacter fuscus]KAB7648635.1 efflux RND transporter permease subunit [Polymorphobacter fuscus]MQT16188.1 AcrB/AcrD/AcrF family protein [Polymorphobacter fuscus]NJC07527.1 multidrug efflux pump subunit AcrB [Polymorphobacter fuscus]
MRNISSWSIKNPIPPLVLFAMLTLAGVVSFMTMDINNQPDIDFPAASVIVSQPGAAPTELETQVTQRVEAAVRGINGVDEITSFVSEGQSRTNIQFAIGVPIDRSVNDVRDAIANIRSDLPQGILQPQVQRVDVSGGPIAFISVEAVDMTLEQLSWFVDNTVAKRLLAIPGMAQVKRSGGVSREIRVVLDPARMQSYGLTASQVNDQLRLVNLNAAGGRTEIAGSEQSVRVLGNADSALALSETQIAVGGGRSVRLADIATVRDSFAEQRSLSKMNGRQVLSFSITKAKGSSDVTVYDQAHAELDKLAKENPQVHFTELYTSVEYTKEQYRSAIDAMVEGAALAVLVVFIFLKDWRATVISALAIPLSAIPAFWFMDLLGFSLNNLSLLALGLVAGVLVDDAIVEIENIVRHMRMGKSAYQAAMDAADEIGLAVVATTSAIVAVFLPVGLMPGISGQFFKNFAFTVVVSVLLSLAVARLITPMLAAYFLKSKGQAAHGEGAWVGWYMTILRWSLRNRWKVVLLGGGGALAGTVLAFATLPLTFQPTTNTDFSQVTIALPPGSTLAQTTAVADRATAILTASPVVEAAFSDINIGAGDIFLTLKKDRPMTSVEFERNLAPKLQAIPDARVNFQSQSGGFNGRDMSVVLTGNDPVLLETTASRIVDQMRGLKELRQPRIEGDLRRPEITIKPRFAVAAQLGVTTAALSSAIRIATLGDIDQNVAKFSLSDRQIPIRVALSEDSRRTIATIADMPVPTASGGSVPLKVVADISFGAGATELRRYNQQRRVMIGADLAPGLVSGDAQPKIDALPVLKNLPRGVEKVQFGSDKWQAELLINFVIAVIAGVLLVFAVLVLLYKRVLPPFVNMGSLALAPLGAGIALHLAGMAVSLPVFIGLLMLLGIVAKNSILLVDMAIEEMSQGVERTAAILEAGHKRVQPIIMTTIAMVAGMLPIALSLGGDGSFRAPMGVTVIGGLIMSTALTLVIVPASFSLAVGAEEWLAPRMKRWFTNDEGAKTPKPAPQPAE